MTWVTLWDYLVENAVDWRDRIWIIKVLVTLSCLANMAAGEIYISSLGVMLIPVRRKKNFIHSKEDFGNILSA